MTPIAEHISILVQFMAAEHPIGMTIGAGSIGRGGFVGRGGWGGGCGLRVVGGGGGGRVAGGGLGLRKTGSSFVG